MQVLVKYLDGTRFEAQARGHSVVCDQPAGAGGTDQGMTPPELLLASVGTCVMYYAAEYLKTRRISTEGLLVRTEAEKAMGPARLSKFRIVIELPASVEDRHREGARRAGERCLIKNTLLVAPEVELTVESPAAVQ
jgi:putative redox protein